MLLLLNSRPAPSVPSLDPGITAVVPTVVKERDMVRLICKSKCIGSPPANVVVWSRDGKAVASPTFRAGLDDAGSYQCAWEGLQSNTVTLDVQCELMRIPIHTEGLCIRDNFFMIALKVKIIFV